MPKMMAKRSRESYTRRRPRRHHFSFYQPKILIQRDFEPGSCLHSCTGAISVHTPIESSIDYTPNLETSTMSTLNVVKAFPELFSESVEAKIYAVASRPYAVCLCLLPRLANLGALCYRAPSRNTLNNEEHPLHHTVTATLSLDSGRRAFSQALCGYSTNEAQHWELLGRCLTPFGRSWPSNGLNPCVNTKRGLILMTVSQSPRL
jgi:hypothetical protein